jgi:hypothetical protein
MGGICNSSNGELISQPRLNKEENMTQRKRILIYKRTHDGDPGQYGCFGNEDCMGAVKKRNFDAVIGVGGIGAEAEKNGIAHKVNWIGIGPHKTNVGKRGPLVTFDHFLDFGTDGPDFSCLTPTLANRMYSRNVRHVMNALSDQEYREALNIRRLAESAPPSKRRNKASAATCRTFRRFSTPAKCHPCGHP